MLNIKDILIEYRNNPIGLDVEKMVAEKKVFQENVIPQWLEEAKERESKMDVKSGVTPN